MLGAGTALSEAKGVDSGGETVDRDNNDASDDEDTPENLARRFGIAGSPAVSALRGVGNWLHDSLSSARDAVADMNIYDGMETALGPLPHPSADSGVVHNGNGEGSGDDGDGDGSEGKGGSGDDDGGGVSDPEVEIGRARV